MTTWTIDTTRLPLPDHAAPLHLLLAVDEATGAITMAHLIDGSDDGAVARALTDAVDGRPAPCAIATDHSRTFGTDPNSALRTACNALGISIKPIRTLTPCSKAHAEQALSTVLRHLSPARTRAALDALLPRAVDAHHRRRRLGTA
ncbi:transposase [Kitasatospora xanthocidica]|uniref:Transposase n=1 Tax=Kitasatospora xanthocidica TaxID=83382 RepID=A0A372ZKL8_9ACTN|nr:DDE-type integrase/transposase/recombinase [Kitasatospora xanthocidica]RGD56408.1 transposase [Kitasatospora xanthocidica]